MSRACATPPPSPTALAFITIMPTGIFLRNALINNVFVRGPSWKVRFNSFPSYFQPRHNGPCFRKHSPYTAARRWTEWFIYAIPGYEWRSFPVARRRPSCGFGQMRFLEFSKNSSIGHPVSRSIADFRLGRNKRFSKTLRVHESVQRKSSSAIGPLTNHYTHSQTCRWVAIEIPNGSGTFFNLNRNV